jgi:Na+-driven multidrug efflux pump
MAAQNIGAGKWERVGKITGVAILYNLLITGLLVLLLWFADRPALALFLGGESAAIPIAQHIQLLATWSFVLMGVTMVLFGTVRANGSVIAPLVILAIGLFPVRLGFAAGAYPALGADALWLSFPVASLTNLVLAVAFYLHGGWRKARMGPQPAAEAVEEAHADCEPGGRLNPSG